MLQRIHKTTTYPPLGLPLDFTFESSTKTKSSYFEGYC